MQAPKGERAWRGTELLGESLTSGAHGLLPGRAGAAEIGSSEGQKRRGRLPEASQVSSQATVLRSGESAGVEEQSSE